MLPAGIAGGRVGVVGMGLVGVFVGLVAVPKWLLCPVLLDRQSRPGAQLTARPGGPGAVLVPGVWHHCCCWLACLGWAVASWVQVLAVAKLAPVALLEAGARHVGLGRCRVPASLWRSIRGNRTHNFHARLDFASVSAWQMQSKARYEGWRGGENKRFSPAKCALCRSNRVVAKFV